MSAAVAGANDDASKMATDVKELIQDIGTRLLQNNYVYLSAETMKQCIKNCGDNKTEKMTSFWDQTAPQRDENGVEVYPGKRSLCSYYERLGRERSSGLETTLEYIDPTTVHQVSNQRFHKAWPVSADSNPLLKDLRDFLFQVLQTVIDDPATKYEAMQTAYRVTKNINANLQGDPGPEGIHQDSATLTVILLVGRQNVQGGINRVWSLEQENGKPQEQDLQSDRLITQLTLEQPFDTLMVLDRKVKHEATAIYPVDPKAPAIRDVLTFEIRQKQT